MDKRKYRAAIVILLCLFILARGKEAVAQESGLINNGAGEDSQDVSEYIGKSQEVLEAAFDGLDSLAIFSRVQYSYNDGQIYFETRTVGWEHKVVFVSIRGEDNPYNIRGFTIGMSESDAKKRITQLGYTKTNVKNDYRDGEKNHIRLGYSDDGKVVFVNITYTPYEDVDNPWDLAKYIGE